MGNSSSMYDVRLDGEIITDLPKSLYEPLQMLMNGHQTLIVVKKPEIIERSVDISGDSGGMTVVMQETIDRINKVVFDQQKQLTDTINTTVDSFNTQIIELKRSIDGMTKTPQGDSSVLKTTIDLLAGRVNDIANTLPSTLTDRFNGQTERLIESINDTLRPKDSLNATIKGAAYEMEVVQGFESLNIPTLSIERVSTDTACCDIHVIDTSSKILFAVECKNYSRNVGEKEVDKFYRDLSNLKDNYGSQYKAIIGMFLSKQTNIVRHGAIDIDSQGNVFLASDYNNPLMWHAIMVYYNRIYENKNTFKPEEGDDHMKVLLSVYNAMKEAESISGLIAKNIDRLNDSIKDLKVMADRIKPISEIIDQFAGIYGLSSPEKKTKNRKSNKKEITVESPVEINVSGTIGVAKDNSQLDIEPVSDYDSDGPGKVKPKRKYVKKNVKKETIEPLVIDSGEKHHSIGWSDSD